MSITVTPINDAPTGTSSSYVLKAGTPLTVDAPGLLANATDVDSASLVVILVSGPTHGTLDLVPTAASPTPGPGVHGRGRLHLSHRRLGSHKRVRVPAGGRDRSRPDGHPHGSKRPRPPPPSGGGAARGPVPTAPGVGVELPATGSNPIQPLVLAVRPLDLRCRRGSDRLAVASARARPEGPTPGSPRRDELCESAKDVEHGVGSVPGSEQPTGL